MIGHYTTPFAFRDALESRLRNEAQHQGTDLQRLRRCVAFDRLLARLFAQPNPPWLLKGGYALEMRLRDRARATLDLDIAVPEPICLELLEGAGREATCADAVLDRLQEATERDQGDGFTFVVGRVRGEQIGPPRGGLSVSVDARLAGRTFAQFRADVGLGDAVLGSPDWITGDAQLSFADIAPARVALYPLAQQFAEKLHAYTLPRRGRENTRVKDLVDLALLLEGGMVEPAAARRAVKATFEARRTHVVPDTLPGPPQTWKEPYEELARVLALCAATLSQGFAFVDATWQAWRLGQS